MLTTIQALVLGSLQGFSELFPISSLGHTVIIPQVLGWPINQHEESFVIFIVATHVTTACILFIYYWRDWSKVIPGFFRTLKARRIPEGDAPAKLAWLIVVATIPGGLLGLLFDAKFETLFARSSQAAFFLIINGLILFGAEMLRRDKERVHGDVEEGIARLSFKQALGIGFAQSLALFPGISRTGATIGAGLLARLSHEEALTFSFMLAAPIIFAAGMLKLPKLFFASEYQIFPIVIGSLASGFFAYLSVRFLSKYFKTDTLMPFAIYCVIAGALAFVFLG